MSGEDDLLGIGLALFIVVGVLVFAMSGMDYAGIAGIDARQAIAALPNAIRSAVGISGL